MDMKPRRQNWLFHSFAATACLMLGATTAFAQNLDPRDALDESKVGIAARFISIKAGKFDMGSPDEEAGRGTDETQHLVKLTKNYEIQATEVTQLQYFLVMGRNPSKFWMEKSCDANNFKSIMGRFLCSNHPVEGVSWYDAQNFIAKLNQIQNEYVYRLPTEAEWEYAARGGLSSRFPYSFGYNDNNLLDEYGWYSRNSNNRTHAVASKKPNPYGLYDVHGNVWEWVQDIYGEYPMTQATDPTGARSGWARVVRGGSWFFTERSSRSASRYRAGPEQRREFYGFRLVRTRK